MCALRNFLSANVGVKDAQTNLNHMKFLFDITKDGQNDIFSHITNLSASLRHNISNVNNLVMALGIA